MVGASARGVSLFMRHHEAGAHGVAFSGFRVFPSALANAHATQRGMSKAAIVLRILEMSCRIPGMVVGAKTQVLVNAIGIDNLAGVHLPIGVPDRLELAEGLNEFFPEHLVKKLSL